MRVMEDGRVLPDEGALTHKVQIRDVDSVRGKPAWKPDMDGPESWLGAWMDLGVDGCEAYCVGFCDGAGRYCDYAYYYRVVPVENSDGT